jgi:WhiB family redox-sensing transcriptional regulator
MFDPEASSTMMLQARRICKRCPVQIECLEAAVENNAHGGVWGGVSGEVGHIAALRKAKEAKKATSDPPRTDPY